MPGHPIVFAVVIFCALVGACVLTAALWVAVIDLIEHYQMKWRRIKPKGRL